MHQVHHDFVMTLVNRFFKWIKPQCDVDVPTWTHVEPLLEVLQGEVDLRQRLAGKI